MTWWVHDLWSSQSGRIMLVSWVFWVVTSIVLHELAHGWAALWQGDQTPRALGRMTWNPTVHIPPMAWLMFAFIGITWGLMPVDPSRYRWGRRGRVVVSGAGPAMNILLFFVLSGAFYLWMMFGSGVDPEVHQNISTFLYMGAKLNVVLAILNLMPVPPLDGSSILSGLSMKWYIWSQNPQFVHLGFFILLIFFLSPVGRFLWAAGDLAFSGLQGLLP